MDTKTQQPLPSATTEASRRDTVIGDTPAAPPQPSQRMPNKANPFEAAIQADLQGMIAKAKDSEHGPAVISFLQRLGVLGGRLGKMKDEKWTYVCGTTVLAMFDIKALITDPSLPDGFLRVFDQQYRSHLQQLQWRFDDAFETINFLSAHGRNNPLFATNGIAYVNIPVPLNSDGACCRAPNRETEARHCEMEECMICENTSLFPGILPSSTEFDGGLVQDFDRPPCGHAQLDRMVSLIAARVPGSGFFEENALSETITRMRRQLYHAWKDRQIKSGWQFTREDHWPPEDQNQPVTINIEEPKSQVVYRLSLTQHDRLYVAHWGFIGPFGLLI